MLANATAEVGAFVKVKAAGAAPAKVGIEMATTSTAGTTRIRYFFIFLSLTAVKPKCGDLATSDSHAPERSSGKCNEHR